MPKKFWNKPASKLTNNIIIYDIESGGLDVKTAEPLSFYGLVIDINTLEPKEDGEFYTLIKPTIWENVQAKALEVNKLTREEIEEKGVDQADFFKQLTHFLQKFQKDNRKWSSLYSAGYNIIAYDNQIMNRLAINYNYVEGSDPRLFHPIHSFDLREIIRPFFFSNNELESYSLENLCKYMGLEYLGGHTAEADVKMCWAILRRYLKWYVNNSPKWIKEFKNCFGEKNDQE